MSLQSLLFRGNALLQQCLVSDAAHVRKGARGGHVRLIHNALLSLDHPTISSDELTGQTYGPSTAAAVLKYKEKRKSINFSYQTSPDDIVGKMTIRALDTKLIAKEQGHSRVLLSFGVTMPSPPRVGIVAQNHPLPATWAKQMVDTHTPNISSFTSPKSGPPEANVEVIKKAISAANHGLVIFSVGHGIVTQGFKDQGGFDCADDKRLRLGGKGSFADPATFVDVFYDDKPPAGSTLKFSPKETDERLGGPGSQQRLKNWSVYLDLCKAFVDGRVAGVLLLTCNVGNATGFLKKVATQWQTTIIGYNEFTTYQGGFPQGRVRSIFDVDKNKQNTANPGSNIPFAEIMFPLSMTKMVSVKP